MREIISLHVGQAGVQVGNACWELFCHEHGIQPDGTLGQDRKIGTTDIGSKAFFAETQLGKFVPRSVYVDLEPTVIDQVRKGTYKELFHPEYLISGKEDAANNYARGRYTIGKKYTEQCLAKIQKMAENCDSFQGIMLYNAIGGGTGSGMGSYLMERLSVDFGSKWLMNFPIFPSPQLSTSIVEPYNAVLSFRAQVEHSKMSVVFDNEALYEVCQRNLDIEKPTYSNINRIIAQVISSMTSSIRFDGSVNIDLSELMFHQVQYPRLHFLMSSYAPLNPSDRANEPKNLLDLTNSLFVPENLMVKCDPKQGLYTASSLLYRGDLVQKDCAAAVGSVKANESIQFVDWSPKTFQVGLNYQNPSVIPGGEIAKSSRSVCMIGNNTSITQLFRKITKKFDMMYSKRAFVGWWVGEGMEEGWFPESREDIEANILDYIELQKKEAEGEEEEEGEGYEQNVNNKQKQVKPQNEEDDNINRNQQENEDEDKQDVLANI